MKRIGKWLLGLITSALTLLQIKGYVRALPGKRFSLAEKQS